MPGLYFNFAPVNALLLSIITLHHCIGYGIGIILCYTIELKCESLTET